MIVSKRHTFWPAGPHLQKGQGWHKCQPWPGFWNHGTQTKRPFAFSAICFAVRPYSSNSSSGLPDFPNLSSMPTGGKFCAGFAHQCFRRGRSQPANERMLFRRDNGATLFRPFQHGLCVIRLDGMHIQHSGLYSLLRQHFRRRKGALHHQARGHNGHVAALAQHIGLARAQTAYPRP